MPLFEQDIDIVITIFGALYFVLDVEYSFPSLFATRLLLMGNHWNSFEIACSIS